MGIITYLLVNGLAIFVASQVLSGVHVDGFVTALIVAIVLGVVNTLIKPLLIILTLPLTVLTFGLFSFVINALLVLLVSHVVRGFAVDGFWWALAFSLVIAVISSFLNALVKNR